MPVLTAFTFPPPPRRVRRKAGTGCAVAFPRLFILPHCLFGIGMLLDVPARFYVYHCGTPVKAIIQSIERRASKKGGDYYVIGYHYSLNHRRFDEENQTLSAGEGMHTKVGDTIDGRAAGMLVGSPMFLRTDEGDGDTWRLLWISLVWNCFCALGIYVAWVIPIRQRRLVRFGVATPGVITERKESRRRGVTYTIAFEFVTSGGDMVTGEQDVSKRGWDLPGDGSMVTVIYDPRRPRRRRIVYELSDFAVEAG
jgi:hypothetical protein